VDDGVALEPAGGKEKYFTFVKKQLPVMQQWVILMSYLGLLTFS
jgi:hypothetical protein